MEKVIQIIDQLKSLYLTDNFAFSFNCSMILAGDSNKKTRQLIVEYLTGKKDPVSKCGLNRVSELIKADLEQSKLF